MVSVTIAIWYSDRLAMLKDGSLIPAGILEIVITPKIVPEVLGVSVAIINTSVGLQISPLASTHRFGCGCANCIRSIRQLVKSGELAV
jgi:iron complex transport system ATP-binding protein